MQIKSIAAVGALGAGLGVASFIGGTGTASADQCGIGPIGIINPQNIICNIQAQGSSFAMSVNPANQVQTFLYGTKTDTGNDGLGIVDQPSTFLKSLQTFAAGPSSPDAPAGPADPHAPGG